MKCNDQFPHGGVLIKHDVEQLLNTFFPTTEIFDVTMDQTSWQTQLCNYN